MNPDACWPVWLMPLTVSAAVVLGDWWTDSACVFVAQLCLQYI